ncbi:hypothetical protein QBC43DRAFT_311980 [Cladorrhinum sp. PSN259]|nr:hypothetical protein QBC43DRAFT_311980 [Cladorrhinum sp. PSN259]
MSGFPLALCFMMYPFTAVLALQLSSIISTIMWLSKSSICLLVFATLSQAQYTGPCSVSNCGATGKVCPRGYLCVPWPSFEPALRKGCTCSIG